MQWSHSCISSSCTERYRSYFVDGLELGHVLVGCVCYLCLMESVTQIHNYVDQAKGKFTVLTQGLKILVQLSLIPRLFPTSACGKWEEEKMG